MMKTRMKTSLYVRRGGLKINDTLLFWSSARGSQKLFDLFVQLVRKKSPYVNYTVVWKMWKVYSAATASFDVIID